MSEPLTLEQPKPQWRCRCSTCRKALVTHLLEQLESLRDWKSPDGVLQVKDLEWFKELPR